MKPKPGGKWNFIVLEGYCAYKWAHNKYTRMIPVEFLDGKMISGKGKKEKNPCFINAKIPKYCPRKDSPRYICLAKNCPFFCYSEANVKGEKELKKGHVALVVDLND